MPQVHGTHERDSKKQRNPYESIGTVDFQTVFSRAKMADLDQPVLENLFFHTLFSACMTKVQRDRVTLQKANLRPAWR